MACRASATARLGELVEVSRARAFVNARVQGHGEAVPVFHVCMYDYHVARRSRCGWSMPFPSRRPPRRETTRAPGAAFASWRRAKALVIVRSNRTKHLQLRAGHLKVRHTAEMDEMWFEKRMNLGHKSSRIVLALWQNSVSRVRCRMLCVQQLALLCTCGGAGDEAIRWIWQVNCLHLHLHTRLSGISQRCMCTRKLGPISCCTMVFVWLQPPAA